MIEVGREPIQRYVTHKDRILLALGQAWWPHVTIAAVKIKRAKTFLNRLENQGSVHGLCKQYGMMATQTTDKNFKNINIQLPNGILRMKDYIYIQEKAMQQCGVRTRAGSEHNRQLSAEQSAQPRMVGAGSTARQQDSQISILPRSPALSMRVKASEIAFNATLRARTSTFLWPTHAGSTQGPCRSRLASHRSAAEPSTPFLNT